MKRLLALFRRSQLERRLAEEFAHHLASLEADLIAQGHSPTEAKRLARLEFGNAESIKDQHRDARGLPWLEDFLSDLRLAARQLRQAPGYCAIAILTMSLGIGANTAIFTLVNAALLKQAPYPDPTTLKDITRAFGGRLEWPVFDSRQFVELRDKATSFSYVAAMRDKGHLNWLQDRAALEIKVMRVSADYFRALGIEPQYGRSFERREESMANAPVAIVSHGFASRHLNNRLDQVLNLGGTPHAVVGILPAHFPAKDVEVYLPMEVRPIQDGDNTQVFGRLKPGVTNAQASEQCTALIQALIRSEYKNRAPQLRISMEPYGSVDGRQFQSPLMLLTGSVALILLIACANLANLMLARATIRVREMAIRASLGAGRFRLARQMIAESLLLSLLGGLAGLALAAVLLPLLIAASPVDIADLWSIRIDTTVFLYALSISIATGILFGLIPAWAVGNADPIEAMKDGGAKASSGRGSASFRRALVVAEIALSVVLLAGSGLLLKSLIELIALPSGVDESRVIAAQMSLRGELYNTSAKASRLFSAGLDKLRALPNVESAAVTLALPLERGLNCSVAIPLSMDRPERLKFINWRYTSSNYLEAMHVPLLKGRYLQPQDLANSMPVAVVSEAFVKRYLDGLEPIGMSVVEHCGGKTSRTIVGVVADLKTNSLRDKVPPTMYVPIEQATDQIVAAAHTWFPMSWVVRTKDSSSSISADIRAQLQAVDPLQPIHEFNTIEDLRNAAVSNERFLAYLIAAFALLALTLTSAGIYGVLSYVVSQRGMEFAIRLALGAPITQLSLSVLAQGLRLAAYGLLVGSGASYGLFRWLRSVSPDLIPPTNLNPALVAAPIAILALAVILACLAPAFRVARIHPNAALRAI